MKCTDIDALLCDYVDGALGTAERAQVDEHVRGCEACAAALEDARAAVAFMDGAADVEVPDELVTRILYRTHGETPAQGAQKEEAAGGGWLGWLHGFFRPVLAPRFAMGMAMTILSFSMIGRMAGIPQRPLTAADLEPAQIWAAIDHKAHRTYDRFVKYIDNLRLVYEIQSRLSEWSAQDEQAAAAERARRGRRVDPVAVPPAAQPQQQPEGSRKQ